jgi:hypothetical protein
MIAYRAAAREATASRKSPGTPKIVFGFYNALVLSTLQRGKELQLWDSNVHRITTQGYKLLRVPADYHN